MIIANRNVKNEIYTRCFRAHVHIIAHTYIHTCTYVRIYIYESAPYYATDATAVINP
jgi:hypothetical protein